MTSCHDKKSGGIQVNVIDQLNNVYTFNDLTKINEELKYIMNLEEKIPMNLITQIRVYKLNTMSNG